MGRQPYLTRLALGRSAFEPPTEDTFPIYAQSTDFENVSDDPNEAPREYVQLYDDAGRPVNPRSQAYGRQLRAAQNDVFAAFGVVQRKEQEAAGLEDEDEDTEAEDLTADTISASTLSYSPVHLLTWWLEVLKAKILGFQIPSNTPLSRIIQSEYEQYGASIFYRGLSLSLAFNLLEGYFSYELSYSRLLAQFLLWAKVSRNTRRMLLKTTVWGSRIFSFLVDLLLLPIGYYGALQTLGLVPTGFLPPLKILVPGTRYCPWPRLSVPDRLSLGSLASILTSTIVSPAAVLLCSVRLNRLVYNSICNHLPSGPDIHARLLQPLKWDEENKECTEIARIALRDDRPLLTRTLSFLGWGFAFPQVHVGSNVPILGSSTSPSMVNGQDIPNHANISTEPHRGFRLTSTTSSAGLLPPRPPRNPIATFHDILADEASTELPPSPGQRAQVDAWIASPQTRLDFIHGNADFGNNSHGASNSDRATADTRTRVRITTREPGTLTVELEIDAVEADSSSEPRVVTTETIPTAPLPPNLKPHRVTRLTRGPSKFLADMLAVELLALVDLPFKFTFFRFCALYFAEGTGHSSTSSALKQNPLHFLWGQLAHVRLGTVGSLVYRMLFCATTSLALDFAVWGINYGLTRYIGITHYRWGKL